MSVFGYVQAGGGSTRFGVDKALVEFDGKSMLQRSCDLLSAACKSARIIAPVDKYPQAAVPVIADKWPGEGPLGGILTALYHAEEISYALAGARTAGLESRSFCLILSCDMPFLTLEWLIHMVDRAAISKAEVIVPKSQNGLEPLCACWRTDAAPAIQSSFKGGVRKVTEAMKRLRMEVLDEAVWKRFDTDGRLFWNMNTPEDYAEARRVFEQRHGGG
ncbi:MAG TPA: molybdenum cofactor guanylyltransferase [Candidatus Eisenbacteria bacterium]|nr:molybdenum cofactor guanylyltransferase [Candidatus Eisenbacteria bacterium]